MEAQSAMLLEDRLDRVRAQRNLARSGAAQTLHDAIAELAELADPASIAPMLLLLTEDTASEAANWSLLGAAEAFEDAVYVGEMLLAMPTLNRVSPKWAEIVLLRTLKKESARLVLARRLGGSARAEKDAVNAICGRILQSDPSQVSLSSAVIFASRT